jgi:hypothetical protein
MKNIVRISKKAAEWCDLMNYDITKVKEHMYKEHFAVQKCETKEEMDNEGVEYDHPYVLFNPFSLNVKK